MEDIHPGILNKTFKNSKIKDHNEGLSSYLFEYLNDTLKNISRGGISIFPV